MIDKKILSELNAAVKEEQTEAENERAFENCAKIAKGMYSAYTAAGLTETQALYLTATIIASLCRKN